MNRSLRSAAIATLACLFISGCHVNEHKDGNKDNVDISTPFGGMHVKTNTSTTDTSAIGLTIYPGAVPVHDAGDNDTNSANVDMSFGGFHLGVRAASFQTPDSQDKVLTFYRKDLSRYGNVIECQNDKPVGTPTRTTQGLSCSDSKGAHISTGDDKGNKGLSFTTSDSVIHKDGSSLELRAGSERHQHIVGVEPKDGGIKIGLVALDLPGSFDSHDDKDSE